MIRLSRIALGPMRQRTCITLHHAVQLQPRRRTCNRPRELDRVCTYRGILGSHVIMVITPTIGSSALATHESAIHAVHTFCITSTLAQPCRQNTLGWDRETRAWSRDLYGRSNRIRAIVSQGHGCKVCIYFVTLRRYRFPRSLRSLACSYKCWQAGFTTAAWITVFRKNFVHALYNIIFYI